MIIPLFCMIMNLPANSVFYPKGNIRSSSLYKEFLKNVLNERVLNKDLVIRATAFQQEPGAPLVCLSNITSHKPGRWRLQGINSHLSAVVCRTQWQTSVYTSVFTHMEWIMGHFEGTYLSHHAYDSFVTVSCMLPWRVSLLYVEWDPILHNKL